MANYLRGPKGVTNNENLYDENVVETEVSNLSNDVHNDDVMNDANKIPKEPKQSFPKHVAPSLPFLKACLRQSLICNLGGF